MPYQAANFPIGGREAYSGLLWKYSIMAVYSAASSLLGATTVGRATDPFYARLFPALLFLACCAALVGVVVSRWTARVWVEYVGTAALLAGMAGYAIAIGYVGIAIDHDWSRLPPAILPIALMVFPVMRLRNILRTVAAWRAARIARASREEETGDADA
ncbi:MAG: hypothetical protein K0S37_2612 [Microbacterium sp.]|jgi:hypothetical protein|nr:hypothetical protein [Microbacterium sp.]